MKIFPLRSCGKRHAHCKECNPDIYHTGPMTEERKSKLRKPKSNTEKMKHPHSSEHIENWKISIQKYWDENRKPPKLRPTKEETRSRMSAARKGFKHTEETKARMSAASMGNKNGVQNLNKTGTKWTDKQRENFLAKNKGRIFTDEHKKNLSLANSKRMSEGRLPTAFTYPQMNLASFFVSAGLIVELEKQFGTKFVDIYLPEYNLGVEADGEVWHNPPFGSPEKDAKRDAKLLEKFGLCIARFGSKEIENMMVRESDIRVETQGCKA